ncbi:MAG TPA: Calx-beta domain-containing protein [Pyrinomonadaceae bacterium]|nr:Calx-beta domain-containing protein [Pyrinomonadaceae bacterium]
MYAGTSAFETQDAFVTKLNSSGSGLLFSTYLGGSKGDSGTGIAVDAAGNIYVAGETSSKNFPAVNALQSSPTATDNCFSGFVTKINPAVPSYVFSTYLGGSSCDTAYAIALDTAADIYIAGQTTSSDFPTANAFQSNMGDNSGGDAFVTKLTTNGSMVYSTFFGGESLDSSRGVAVNSSGEAIITGNTSSDNFPTQNPIHGFSGNTDVFVTKFNSQGSALVYSTYLGGDADEFGRGIAVDAAGNAHVVGLTNSQNFPIVPGAVRNRSTLFKSIDGGTKWSNDNYGLSLGFNSAITSLIVHPTQTSTIYAGTLKGVYKSINGGRTWSPINNGLTIPRVTTLLMDPQTPSTLYAAAQEFDSFNFGVFKSTDGGNTWNLRKNGMGNGEIVSVAIDPVTPNILYAGTTTGTQSGGQVFKTTDGADNWAPVGTNVPAPSFSSLAVDPHNHTMIYGAASVNNGAIFKSVDSGATWNPVGFSQTGGLGRSVAVSPHTPGLLYARLNFFQGIFKSTDGGANWVKVTTRDGEIVLDPVSPSTVYLLTGLEGVFKSTDNGVTWVQLTKGYNNGPVTTALVVDPLKPSTLYFATLPAGADDSFVVGLNPSGSALLYSTFLGGTLSNGDFSGVNAFAVAIALDSSGNTYISGSSQSPTFPTTPNSFQPLHRAFHDAFVMKLTMSHIISGHVRDGSSAPVSGADVVLNDGTSIFQVTTEADGSYEFSRLRQDGNYTVSASKAHFTMAPPSQTFNNLTSNQTLNFTATATAAAFHTISGQITNNGSGLAGVTVTLSGSQSGLRTTDANGNYSFALAAGANYILTPSLLGFTFGPINLTFNNLSASQAANFTATRQNFVVTNTNNHGAGSLRDAIVNANATVGTDTIVFNIPGPGVKTINPVNQLPDLTDPVVIDGTTQPGYSGSPLIEISGIAISSGRGLVIKAGGSTVRGLAIGNFSSGNAIFVTNCDNNVFQANYLGLEPTGTAARPNGVGLFLSNSSNNLIGGTTAAARNVISANLTAGINLSGSNNVVQGNYIGTNPSGTAGIGFAQNGIEISGAGTANNLIGGTSPGAGNVISGNSRGIVIVATGTTIQGNLIGTDATGTSKINGSVIGIQTLNSTNTVVGGLTAGARNIISGHGGNGVFLSGVGSRLQGNFIGTDITGTLALGNSNTGVVAGNGALIGGTTPEARNVIAANGGFGNIALGENNSGVAATVQGNYIGTDVTGTKALSSNSQNGITIFTNGHLIGGTAPGARNVISGNVNGIRVGVFSGDVTGNVILGNLIGLNAQGTGPLPNSQTGVHFASAQNNTLGGLAPAAANKIAFNGGPGVVLTFATRISIRGNSIFGNNGLGIDLDASGVSPNDLNDPDVGANNLQNFPVINTVSSNGSSTTILGSLNSTPNTTFQIDFYSNAAVDPSGHGEGALFFSTTSVTTNASGNASIDVTFPIALPSGRVISATATDPNGNTSEFSAAPASAAAGSVQFGFDSFFVIEDVGMATVTVQRAGGFSGNLSVEYETTNGTAIAGQDYTASSGTVNFANGETSKTIQIPITNDSTTEPDETFTLSLKNPSALDSLGAPMSMVITIQDQSTVPALLEFGANVIEGDAGTTTQMLLEVRLSSATGRTVSVDYATADFNAHSGAACGTQGVDYEPVAGKLTFQPGSFSMFVPVKICGDKSAEANETFTFNLSKAVNATIADGQGIGVITNDDVMELVLEDSGPLATQAAAIDALRFVRDPFPIVSVPEAFAAAGFDRNTRVMLFVRNLELNPGENSSAVVVRLIGSNNQVFEVFSEDFGPVPNTDLMQVVFRVPNNLPAGQCNVIVRSHGRFSNVGTIRIAP